MNPALPKAENANRRKSWVNPALSMHSVSGSRKRGVKILHVTTHMNTGGIANYILSLAKALKEKGVECVVASSGGDMVAELERNDIPHLLLDIRTKFEFGPKVLKSIFKIRRIIEDDGIDIVHCHTRVSQVAGYLASRMAKRPYMTTCHGFFKKKLGRRLFDTWGDKVIAISEPVKQGLIRDFNVAPKRIELIPSGVGVDRFRNIDSGEEVLNYKRELNLSDGMIIGTIGRLSPVKGHKIYIEAMSRVLRKGYRVKGIIVGDGPEEANLKALVEEFGIGGSFKFFKSTPETTRYLSIMDIFVFPSIKEGLGLALLEAMAAGRPCVASNVGGISDIIEEGKTGLLFDAGDVDAMADRIIRLLDDAGLKERLGRAGREFVRERYSIDVMAEKMASLYKHMKENCAEK